MSLKRTSGRKDASAPTQASRSLLARTVHRLFPPPSPAYGKESLCTVNREPRGVRRRLHKLFPPPLQTEVSWYAPSLTPKITEHGDFYHKYTGIETEKNLIEHVHAIRDQVWAFAPYPCIGRGWFLLPGLSGMKEWPEVVEAAKEGKTILDLGCGLGQDIRRLYSDAGRDTANLKLYASDVNEKLWEMGCELFRDHKMPVAKFLCADAMIYRAYCSPDAPFGPEEPFDEVRGQVDVILTSQLLDLFHYNDQRHILGTIFGLSHVGTKVIGRTLGATEGESCEDNREGDAQGMRMYHCTRDLKGLWWHAGRDTQTSWKAEVEEVDFEQWGFDQDDIAWLDEPPPKGLDVTMKGLNFVFERVE